MKRKTYRNVLRAMKMIQAKGYTEEQSLEMAISVFDNMESTKNGMSAEWWIDKIMEAE